MKVTGWTSWNNNYEDVLDSVENFTEEFRYKVYNVVANELKDKGYKFSGSHHQRCETGCPIIDDKYTLKCSMRGWGEIMRIAYDIPNEDGMGYCAWAWCTPNGETVVLPESR